MAFWHEGFCKQEAISGTGPAEKRCCILEARALSYNEDKIKQAEERQSMVRQAGLCRGEESGLKTTSLMSLQVNPGPFFRYPTVPPTCHVSLTELPDPSCLSLLARVGLSSGRHFVC